MQSLTKKMLAALTVAAALMIGPAAASAQDCTARLSPSQIESGSDAVLVTVTLEEDMGQIESVESEEGNIESADPTDIPRTEMAAGEEDPQPIRQGADQTTWTVWLNTSDAEEGTFPLTFVTSEGDRCTAELQVTGR